MPHLCKRLLIAILLLPLQLQAAGYYTWTDDNGVTHLTDRPPAQSQQEVTQGEVSVPAVHDAPGYRLPSWGEVRDRPTGASVTTKKVVIYTTQRCGYCKKAKAYMRANNIRFTEYDVETSDKGKRDYRRMGGSGVPIIMVDNQRINGFNQSRLARALGL